ncbi:MAG: ring-cleaving dioxygenase [Tepidisphaeraceae bacterium]
MQLTGIHHLTAVTANATGNNHFYTDTLGMRRVKLTVNQDDVSSYHLFYADGKGSPGTDLTFFDWPAARARRGTHSIVRTALRIGSASFDYWQDRFAATGVKHAPLAQRQGRLVLDFEDPEGQRLSLVADEPGAASHAWDRSPVPADHQIHGLGPIMISVPTLAPTADVLTQVMNMRTAGEYALPATDGSDGTAEVHVFAMGDGGPSAELHVAVEPQLRAGHTGAGGVHHVAFRVPTFEAYDEWFKRLRSLGVPSSSPIDRFYFRSLYFREPNGILFELATDEPGFAADEPMESLGEKLSLPPFLEGRRQEIEAGLKPLA